MSSNIKINRICEQCGNEFIAKTTVTRFCGHRCASRAYKKKQKEKKIERSNEETKKTKTQPVEILQAKEFLTVRDMASLLNCSLRTAYRLIDNGTIQAVNLAERMTRVKRSELDKILRQPKNEVEQPKPDYDISECYTLKEVQEKYEVSERTVQEVVKRNNIPKIKKGWYAYVPKIMIDEILK